jgi:predicted nucleotidyltransferase
MDPAQASANQPIAPRHSLGCGTLNGAKMPVMSRNRKMAWHIPAITPTGSQAPVSKTLPEAVKRIASEIKPEKIILFGSYAYGTPTPDSDVDLLVIWDTLVSGKDRYLRVSTLIVPRPFAVDILVRTPREIKHALQKGDFFIEEITSRGRVLYERPK